MTERYNLANNSPQGLTDLLVYIKGRHTSKGLVFNATMDALIQASEKPGMDPIKKELSIQVSDCSRKTVAKEAIALLNKNFQLNYSIVKSSRKGNMHRLETTSNKDINSPATEDRSSDNIVPAINAVIAEANDEDSASATLNGQPGEAGTTRDESVTELAHDENVANEVTHAGNVTDEGARAGSVSDETHVESVAGSTKQVEEDDSTPSAVINNFPTAPTGEQIVEAVNNESNMTTGSVQNVEDTDNNGVGSHNNDLHSNTSENLAGMIKKGTSEANQPLDDENQDGLDDGNSNTNAGFESVSKTDIELARQLQQHHDQLNDQQNFTPVPASKSNKLRTSPPARVPSPSFASKNAYEQLADFSVDTVSEAVEVTSQITQDDSLISIPSRASKMPKKWYAVRNGRKRGLFASWEVCKKHVIGFKKAEYKGFTDVDKAKQYLKAKARKHTSAKRDGNNTGLLQQKLPTMVHFDASGTAMARTRKGSLKPDNYMSPAATKPSVEEQIDAGNMAVMHGRRGETVPEDRIPQQAKVYETTPQELQQKQNTPGTQTNDSFGSPYRALPQPSVRYLSNGYERMCKLIECGFEEYVNGDDKLWFVWKTDCNLRDMQGSMKSDIVAMKEHVQEVMRNHDDHLETLMVNIGAEVDDRITQREEDMFQSVDEKHQEMIDSISGHKAVLLGRMAQKQQRAALEDFNRLSELQSLKCIKTMNDQQAQLEGKQQRMMAEATSIQKDMKNMMDEMRQVLDTTTAAIKDHSNMGEEQRKSIDKISQRTEALAQGLEAINDKLKLQTETVESNRQQVQQASEKITTLELKSENKREETVMDAASQSHLGDELHTALPADVPSDPRLTGLNQAIDQAAKQHKRRSRKAKKRVPETRVYDEDESSDEEESVWEQYDMEPDIPMSAPYVAPSATPAAAPLQLTEPIQCRSQVMVLNASGNSTKLWIEDWAVEDGSNTYTGSNAVGEKFKFLQQQIIQVISYPSVKKRRKDNFGYAQPGDMLNTQTPMSPRAIPSVDLTLSMRKQQRSWAKQQENRKIQDQYGGIPPNPLFKDAARQLRMEEDESAEEVSEHGGGYGQGYYSRKSYVYTEADLLDHQYIYPNKTSRSIASVRESSFIKDAPTLIRNTVDKVEDIPFFYEKMRTTADTYGIRMKPYDDLRPGDSIFTITSENCTNYEKVYRIMSRTIFAVMSDNKEIFFPFSKYICDLDTTYRKTSNGEAYMSYLVQQQHPKFAHLALHADGITEKLTIPAFAATKTLRGWLDDLTQYVSDTNYMTPLDVFTYVMGQLGNDGRFKAAHDDMKEVYKKYRFQEGFLPADYQLVNMPDYIYGFYTKKEKDQLSTTLQQNPNGVHGSISAVPAPGISRMSHNIAGNDEDDEIPIYIPEAFEMQAPQGLTIHAVTTRRQSAFRNRGDNVRSDYSSEPVRGRKGNRSGNSYQSGRRNQSEENAKNDNTRVNRKRMQGRKRRPMKPPSDQVCPCCRKNGHGLDDCSVVGMHITLAEWLEKATPEQWKRVVRRYLQNCREAHNNYKAHYADRSDVKSGISVMAFDHIHTKGDFVCACQAELDDLDFMNLDPAFDNLREDYLLFNPDSDEDVQMLHTLAEQYEVQE